MIDNQKISFPITLEEFTRMQLEATNRTPTAAERKLYKKCVEFANATYEIAYAGYIEEAFDLTSFAPDGIYGIKWAEKLCNEWSLLGFKTGLEALHATAEAAKAAKTTKAAKAD